MTETSYNGFGIRPAPYKLADGGYSMNLYIVRDDGAERRERKFFAEGRFSTEEEAIAHCINFGKQIIDGKIDDCSVVDL